tara:strand:+ start:142 stop:1752 length:1611 start_codon:yes stop_codon:yes gene_type:complete
MPSRSTLTSRYRDQYRGKVLAELALEKASTTPDEAAIFLEDAPAVTYGSIFEEASSLASALQDLGLQQGDVVSFQLPNWREAVAIDIAASILGIIVNPVIPIYRHRELAFIAKDANTRLIFIPETFRNFNHVAMLDDLKAVLPTLEHIVVVRGNCSLDGILNYADLLSRSAPHRLRQAVVDPDDTKIILYTSGTTGNPKAVKHSHNTLARALDNGREGWRLDSGDIMLMPSPVTHITGFVNGIELPFFSPVKSILMERWEVGQAMTLIKRHGATACVSATPFLQELVDLAASQGEGLPTLRLFACGGASVPPSLIRRAHQVLENCRAFRVYGSTEAPLVTVGFIESHQENLAAETDGRYHNWQVKVLDHDNNPLPQGNDGEIVVAGPALMLGYGTREQTEQAMTSDGFFRTGDIGHITAEGAILITDRKKDIIIRGGENLSAREIEDVLYNHAAIAEAAVIAVPHARLGEGVCACIVLTPGSDNLTLEELKPFLQQCKLAKQKWPEFLHLMDELPKTASGKVRKDMLRANISPTIS